MPSIVLSLLACQIGENLKPGLHSAEFYYFITYVKFCILSLLVMLIASLKICGKSQEVPQKSNWLECLCFVMLHVYKFLKEFILDKMVVYGKKLVIATENSDTRVSVTNKDTFQNIVSPWVYVSFSMVKVTVA